MDSIVVVQRRGVEEGQSSEGRLQNVRQDQPRPAAVNAIMDSMSRLRVRAPDILHCAALERSEVGGRVRTPDREE